MDLIENELGPSQNVPIREPKNEIAESFQIGIAIPVVCTLLGFLMDAAVELHDQFQLVAIEIRNVRPDWRLAPELQAEASTVPQGFP